MYRVSDVLPMVFYLVKCREHAEPSLAMYLSDTEVQELPEKFSSSQRKMVRFFIK